MKQTVKLSLLSVALFSQLQAQNQYSLEAINVTASQATTLSKKDVTDSVTIITKEAIEEARVTNLSEALSKLGNVTISQSGGLGQQTSMFVRGMDTQRVLVLIDGVRLNDPTSVGAAADISQIMLYDVEQIEIIKGSQSGVWGADATGGVINIITSSAKKGVHGVANVEYGSFATKKASLQASYASEDFDVLIGGLYLDTDGFSAVEPVKGSADYGKRYDELGLEKDSYNNNSLNLKLGYNLTKNDRVEAKAQIIDTLVDFDTSAYDIASGAYLPADSTVPKTRLKNRFYNLAYKHSDSMNEALFQYNLSTFKRNAELPNYTGVGIDEYAYKGSVNELKLEDKISYVENGFLRVGASYQKFAQEEVTANANKSYGAISAFATNYNKLALVSDLNTIITESIRYDKYDEFDNSLTGKLGAKQFLGKDYYVSANVGTGYNAPTLGQLYGQFGANPNLKPEKSLTSDVTLGNDNVWITGFYNEIRDLIDYVSDPVTYAGGYAQVDGKSKFKGVELGYEDYLFDAVGVTATYAYVKTQDAKGKALARRPKTQIDAKATYYVSEEFDVGVNAQYIGERYNAADNQGAQTGKYAVVNFVSNVKLNKTITLYGKLDNVADKYYQVVDGYATAGRSLYFGLNAKY